MSVFRIVNTTRSRFNRVQRSAAPQHGRFKQYVLAEQLRLVRGRSIEITEEQLLANLEELRQKWQDGALEVQTPDGRAVDLFTLTAPEPLPPPAQPNFPLDSLANDAARLGLEKIGQPIPQFEGGTTLEEVGSVPDGDPAEAGLTETAPEEPVVEEEPAPETPVGTMEGDSDPAEEPAPEPPPPPPPAPVQHHKKKDRR
jgi:hypothetical protein